MSQILADEIKNYISYYFSINPVLATFFGYSEFDHNLKIFDADTVNHQLQKLRIFRVNFEKLRFEKTTRHIQHQIDIELALSHVEQVQLTIQGLSIYNRDPSLYTNEILYGIYWLLIRNQTKPLPIEKINSRLSQAGRVLAEAEANLSQNAEIPKIWTEIALANCNNVNIFLFSCIKPENILDHTDRKTFENLRFETVDSFQKFRKFLETKILPKAINTFAPGKYNYERFLRNLHFLSYSADEIENIGLEFAENTDCEINKLLTEVKKYPSSQKTEDEFVDSAMIIENYRKNCALAKDFITSRDLITLPENERISVVETPVFAQSTIPFVSYQQPPAFSDSKHGFLWVTQTDEISNSKPPTFHKSENIPVVCAHEVFPGHHVQFLRTNSIERPIRKLFKTSVFVEGWGLYCEDLMFTQGFYDNPNSRIFQLKQLKMRAFRVIIDVRLSTGKISYDKAAQILTDEFQMTEKEATSEVIRYSQNPTQPMSYLLGFKQILELQQSQKEKLGNSFSLKDFHDKFLSFGTIPIEIIKIGMQDS